MGTQGESFMKKTQKGLSILAFETTKQSRILKKRMRTAALQKEVKADLRDLGNLVYNAIINDQGGILGEEEVKILVENIRENKAEIEHLRDAMARLNRTRKHFEEEDASDFDAAPAAAPAAAEVQEPVESAPPEAAPEEAPAPEEAEPLLEPEAEEKPAKPRAKGAASKPKAEDEAEEGAQDAAAAEAAEDEK